MVVVIFSVQFAGVLTQERKFQGGPGNFFKILKIFKKFKKLKKVRAVRSEQKRS